jgi:WD40 repeat protein
MPDPDVQPGPVSGSPTSSSRTAKADSTPRDTSSDLDTLADLLDEALHATPEAREALLARVAARNPAQADELRALIESLPDPEIVSDAHPSGLASAPTPTPDAPFVPGGMATPSTDALASDEAFVGEPAIGETIGGCVLESVLGRGGAGTVYAARQLEPPRPVAVKVLRTAHARLSHIRRFQTEALALARLEHPSIVRIYTSGVARREGVDLPYIVMERVESGEDFVAWARKAGRSRREIAARLADVCDGMQHGHSRGLMHRDLKPSNVLVSVDDRPHIIDFGIVRILGDDAMRAEETFAGALIGTPAYMAPEQFELASSEIDARVDVHALGTILYESLTGRRPYAISRQLAYDAARIMRESTPVSVDRIDATIPRDLAAIVAKATARARERRYATAAEFAEDLRTFVDGRAVRARPESTHERALRWIRRNPASTAAIVVTTIALVAATVFSAVQWQRSRHQLMLASLARAATASAELDLGGAVARIAEARAVSDGKVPPFIFGMLEAPFESTMHEYAQGTSGHRMSGALSPDRRKWIASGDGADVHVVDLETHEVIPLKVPGDPARTWASGFSADGARAFVGCESGIQEVLPDGRFEPRFESPTVQPRGLVPASWAGADLFFIYNGGIVGRFSMNGASDPAALQLPRGNVIPSIVSSGDRLHAISGDADTYAIMVDSEGRLQRDPLFKPPLARANSIAISDSGDLLARGLGEGRVQLLDPRTGALYDEMYVRHSVWSLSFTPSGEHLYVGDRGGRIHRFRILRTAEGPRLELRSIQRTGSRDPVWAIGAIDETRVVANIAYKVVQLDFGAAWPAEPPAFPGGTLLAISAFDGRTVRVVGSDAQVRELDLMKGGWSVPAHGALGINRATAAGIAADGSMVAAWDGSQLVLRDLKIGETRVLDTTGASGDADLDWSDDGTRLACVLTDRVLVFDRGGRLIAQGPASLGGVRAVEFFPTSLDDVDGLREEELIVSAIWDLARIHRFTIEGDVVRERPPQVTSTWFFRSGDRLAMPQLSGAIQLHPRGDAGVLGQAPEAMLDGHTDIVSSFAVSPDGRWGASGGVDGTVRIWNLALAECFLPLYGPGGKVTHVLWSSDGRSLLAIDQFGTVRLYDSVPRRVRLGVAAN